MNIEETIKSKKIPLDAKTIINVMVTFKALEESFYGMMKPFAITSQQFNVLRILRGQKGNPANLSTIQERMIDKKSNTTRLIDKLITKGYVKRQVCESNRRKIELFITKDGLNLLSKIDPVLEKHNQLLTAKMDDQEMKQLNHLLDKLRNNN